MKKYMTKPPSSPSPGGPPAAVMGLVNVDRSDGKVTNRFHDDFRSTTSATSRDVEGLSKKVIFYGKPSWQRSLED